MRIGKDKMNKIFIFLTIIKYLFSIILTMVASIQVDDLHYMMAGILELLIIFIVSNLILSKKLIGQIMNSILILLYNAQMAVLLFANSYITMVMLTNIVSIKALAGKALVYISGAIIILIISCVPIKKITLTKVEYLSMGALCIVLCVGYLKIFDAQYFAVGGYCTLIQQQYESIKISKLLDDEKNTIVDDEIIEYMMNSEFYSEEVENFRDKEENLPENPNIILIFTEGLSQNIISDERNIMPNVKKWQNESLSFENYYNHTFATYRGLQSQLYSGFQLNDFDSNPLVSLQSIMKERGYHTIFINSEPNNSDFTTYLNSFGFDEMIGDTDSTCNGMADSISDKDVYEKLFDVAVKQEATGIPFLLSTYTFGTHASLDSVDEYFEEDMAELNKFYNVDYQFGEFMKKFENSSLVDNTILIFTADHATYQDDSFKEAFPEYKREMTSLDEIPFFIYYKGIVPESVDVAGRNSICMTPTILDYLDISSPNFFVGTSLFSDTAASICETSYTDSYVICTSKDGMICNLDKAEEEVFEEILQNYYILKKKAQ